MNYEISVASQLCKQYPPVLQVKHLTEILSISRNTAYELVRSGQIRSDSANRMEAFIQSVSPTRKNQRENKTIPLKFRTYGAQNRQKQEKLPKFRRIFGVLVAEDEGFNLHFRLWRK